MDPIASIIPLSYDPVSTSLAGYPATGTVIRLSYTPISTTYRQSYISLSTILYGEVQTGILANASISFTGTASLKATGLINASANISISGAAGLVGSTFITASSSISISANANIIGIGLMVASASASIAGEATLTGSSPAGGEMTGTAAISITGQATLIGIGLMTPAASISITGTAGLIGTGYMTATASMSVSGSASIVATGIMSASASVSISGSASLQATGLMLATSSMSITGSATLTADGGYDTDAQDFFDTAGISDTGQKDKANALIVAFKAAGLWTKTYALWLFKTGTTAAQHSYNAKDPALHQITWAGSTAPSHSGSGVDFTGAGYGDTGVNPSTHLTLNSAGAGHYTTKDGSNSGAIIWGCYAANGDSFLYFDLYDGTNYQLDINTYNHLTGAQQGATVLGLHSTNRISSTNQNLYRDGTLHQDTNAAASVGRPNLSIYVGALNNTGSASHFSNEIVQVFFIKSEFWTATEEADAEAAISDYIS